MRLKALRVEGFRNLREVELRLQETATLFYGDNAQGKTNLLEAICVLGTTRSFRESSTSPLVMDGRAQAAVEGEVTRAGSEHTLRVDLGPEGRKAARDGRREAMGEYLGRLPVVVLSAEDRALVKGSQKARRDYLDGAALLDRATYLSEWSAFQRALGQRNRILKEYDRSRERELEAWTATFTEAAEKVRAARKSVAEKAQEWLNHEAMGEVLTLEYHCSGGADLGQTLRERRGQELARGCCAVGPQRDTVELLLQGKPLEVFGSAGQVRSALWRLKLARVQMVAEATGEPPVFLLDDVEGELDALRVREMMEMTRGKAQLFMTATRRLGPEWGEHAAYRVAGGILAA